MNRHLPSALLPIVLALAIPDGLAQSRSSSFEPVKEHFSEETLALQGVLTLLDPDETSVVMARLIVHGSYLLMIYQFSGKEAREVEIRGFRADDRIRNRKGEPVLDYDFSADDVVHLEVRNESRYPLSEYTNLSFERKGYFPDLGLGKARK